MILFYWALCETSQKLYTDEVYGSLAYDGAPLLRVPVCVSRALFYIFRGLCPSSKRKVMHVRLGPFQVTETITF